MDGFLHRGNVVVENFPGRWMSSEKRLYWNVSNVLQWYSRTTGVTGKSTLRMAKDLVTLFLALEIRNNRDEYRKALEIIQALDQESDVSVKSRLARRHEGHEVNFHATCAALLVG